MEDEFLSLDDMEKFVKEAEDAEMAGSDEEAGSGDEDDEDEDDEDEGAWLLPRAHQECGVRVHRCLAFVFALSWNRFAPSMAMRICNGARV